MVTHILLTMYKTMIHIMLERCSQLLVNVKFFFFFAVSIINSTIVINIHYKLLKILEIILK